MDETIAQRTYAAFASAADKEGYKDTARLFRAAAEAEKIHARNHKGALVKLGVPRPAPGLELPRLGTTRENLQAAIKEEAFEHIAMYPAMIREARAERQPEAALSLRYALNAERQHARLFKEALRELNRQWVVRSFYVCPVCGATYAKEPPSFCPVCSTPGVQFKPIR